MDETTGLVPWQPLLVEWDRERGFARHPPHEGVNPWTLECLDEHNHAESETLGRRNGQPSPLQLRHIAIRETMGGKREKNYAEQLAAAHNRNKA